MDLKRPSKQEITNILHLHSLYLTDKINGKLADFSGMDLSGLKFKGATLYGANFQDALLNQCIFTKCEMVGAQFDNVEAKVAVFDECDLDNTSWVGADIERSLFVDMTAIGAVMYDSSITDSMLLRSDITEANLSNTKLEGTEFTEVCLESVIGNKTNVISMQVGGYDVAYTDSVIQIGKYQKTIEEWKSLWKSKEIDAADHHPELPIADFVLSAIRFFPAKPTVTSEK